MPPRSTKFQSSSLTSQMIETMAKEARDTWADEEQIPDIDLGDSENIKLAKQQKLAELLKRLELNAETEEDGKIREEDERSVIQKLS